MAVTSLVAVLPLAAGKINWTQELTKLLHGQISDWWLIFGFAGQFVFFMRFVIQLLASERKGQVVIPTVFWYISLVGTAMLAVYAIHRQDPVFTAGQILSGLIYVRNLKLVYRPKVKATEAATALDGESKGVGA